MMFDEYKDDTILKLATQLAEVNGELIKIKGDYFSLHVKSKITEDQLAVSILENIKLLEIIHDLTNGRL